MSRSGRRRSRSFSPLVLPGLPNMAGKSTSAIHLCRDFQKCEVPLPHFFSALTATDLKFRFPYFCSARISKYLVHLPHLFCQDWMDKSTSAFHLCRDFQRCEVLLPQFRGTFLLCISTQICTVFRETSQVKIETT